MTARMLGNTEGMYNVWVASSTVAGRFGKKLVVKLWEGGVPHPLWLVLLQVLLSRISTCSLKLSTCTTKTLWWARCTPVQPPGAAVKMGLLQVGVLPLQVDVSRM